MIIRVLTLFELNVMDDKKHKTKKNRDDNKSNADNDDDDIRPLHYDTNTTERNCKLLP